MALCEDLAEELTCPIHLEVYDDPMLLSCLHILCKKDVDNMCAGSESLQCPVCSETSLRKDKKPDFRTQRLIELSAGNKPSVNGKFSSADNVIAHEECRTEADVDNNESKTMHTPSETQASPIAVKSKTGSGEPFADGGGYIHQETGSVKEHESPILGKSMKHFVSSEHKSCDLCDQEAATCKCKECDMFLGEQCRNSHLKMPATKRHSIEMIEDILQRNKQKLDGLILNIDDISRNYEAARDAYISTTSQAEKNASFLYDQIDAAERELMSEVQKKVNGLREEMQFEIEKDKIHIFKGPDYRIHNAIKVHEKYKTSWGTELQSIYRARKVVIDSYGRLIAACEGVSSSALKQPELGLFTISQDGIIEDIIAKGLYVDVSAYEMCVYGLNKRKSHCSVSIHQRKLKGWCTLRTVSLESEFSNLCVHEAMITLSSSSRHCVAWHDLHSQKTFTISESPPVNTNPQVPGAFPKVCFCDREGNVFVTNYQDKKLSVLRPDNTWFDVIDMNNSPKNAYPIFATFNSNGQLIVIYGHPDTNYYNACYTFHVCASV